MPKVTSNFLIFKSKFHTVASNTFVTLAPPLNEYTNQDTESILENPSHGLLIGMYIAIVMLHDVILRSGTTLCNFFLDILYQAL